MSIKALKYDGLIVFLIHLIVHFSSKYQALFNEFNLRVFLLIR